MSRIVCRKNRSFLGNYVGLLELIYQDMWIDYPYVQWSEIESANPPEYGVNDDQSYCFGLTVSVVVVQLLHVHVLAYTDERKSTHTRVKL